MRNGEKKKWRTIKMKKRKRERGKEQLAHGEKGEQEGEDGKKNKENTEEKIYREEKENSGASLRSGLDQSPGPREDPSAGPDGALVYLDHGFLVLALGAGLVLD